MSSHRYWRVAGLRAYSGTAIELSSLQLANSGVAVTGTPVANVDPISGTIANLTDGNSATFVKWGNAGQLSIQWDLGAATEVNHMLIGASDTLSAYPFAIRLEYADSASGPWTADSGYNGLEWPGARQISRYIAGSKTYRYWRIYITTNNGDTYTALQEVELHATVGGVDITSTSMSTFQSSYYGGNTGAKAFDNDYTDYGSGPWVTAGGAAPHYVGIDLGTALSVSEVALFPQNYGGGPARAPMDFEVQASADGAAWLTMGSFTGQTGWVAGTGRSFQTSSSTTTMAADAVVTPPSRLGVRSVYVGGESANYSGLVHKPCYRSTKDYRFDRTTGTLTGTVKEKGTTENTPLHRRVRLYRERDGMLIKETWSDATTGAYSFTEIDTLETYTVLAYDYEHNHRAVAADNLTTS